MHTARLTNQSNYHLVYTYVFKYRLLGDAHHLFS